MQPAASASDCADGSPADAQPGCYLAVRQLTLFHQAIEFSNGRSWEHGATDEVLECEVDVLRTPHKPARSCDNSWVGSA
jgi:hypothetical protein